MSAVLAPTGNAGSPPVPNATLKSRLAGTNTLLIGPTGTGKTASLATAALGGLELFTMFTESGLESLIGRFVDAPPYGLGMKEVPENVHWHVLPRMPGSFSALVGAANLVHTLSHEALLKMRDPKHLEYNQFIKFLEAMADFPDDRTGRKFGPVDSWGTGRMFALDSLTGLNPLAMALVIGGKPVKGPGDYGKAQDQLERFIRQCCYGCRCHFALIAHPEREIDQISGGLKLYPSMPGKALAPILAPMFSDVVKAYREGLNFRWSTDDPNMDLKQRNLPISNDLEASFVQIVEKWRSRGGVLEQ